MGVIVFVGASRTVLEGSATHGGCCVVVHAKSVRIRQLPWAGLSSCQQLQRLSLYLAGLAGLAGPEEQQRHRAAACRATARGRCHPSPPPGPAHTYRLMSIGLYSPAALGEEQRTVALPTASQPPNHHRPAVETEPAIGPPHADHVRSGCRNKVEGRGVAQEGGSGMTMTSVCTPSPSRPASIVRVAFPKLRSTAVVISWEVAGQHGTIPRVPASDQRAPARISARRRLPCISMRRAFFSALRPRQAASRQQEEQQSCALCWYMT